MEGLSTRTAVTGILLWLFLNYEQKTEPFSVHTTSTEHILFSFYEMIHGILWSSSNWQYQHLKCSPTFNSIFYLHIFVHTSVQKVTKKLKQMWQVIVKGIDWTTNLRLKKRKEYDGTVLGRPFRKHHHLAFAYLFPKILSKVKIQVYKTKLPTMQESKKKRQ